MYAPLAVPFRISVPALDQTAHATQIKLRLTTIVTTWLPKLVSPGARLKSLTKIRGTLSKGNAPFPAPIANAVCGPQKPDSSPLTHGTEITHLNPCQLNACCNIWGQCRRITKDFCVDTNTGAPGTAKPGTYGCISNCGTDIIKSTGSGGVKIAYFEGYGLNSERLLQDASQIDTTQYTHVHFAFGTLRTNYEVETGDTLSTYQFSEFKGIKGAKTILSFEGWDFSTFPAT
jgi:hypothetical protein